MTDNIKFIHISDTHILRKYAGSLLEGMADNIKNDPVQRLVDLLKYVSCKYEDLDFIMITGDLVHEGTAQDYAYFREILTKNLDPLPVLTVLGNHDRTAAFYEGYLGKKNIEKPYYYTEYVKGYRIIALDSSADKSGTGEVDPIQIAWLKNELIKPSENGSIVMLHHPLAGGNLDGIMALKNTEDLAEILEQGDVRAVFSGHTHQNSVVSHSGLNSYTAGSTAFGVAVDNANIHFTHQTGFTYCEVTPEEIYAENMEFPNSPIIKSYSFKEIAQELGKES